MNMPDLFNGPGSIRGLIADTFGILAIITISAALALAAWLF